MEILVVNRMTLAVQPAQAFLSQPVGCRVWDEGQKAIDVNHAQAAACTERFGEGVGVHVGVFVDAVID